MTINLKSCFIFFFSIILGPSSLAQNATIPLPPSINTPAIIDAIINKTSLDNFKKLIEKGRYDLAFQQASSILEEYPTEKNVKDFIAITNNLIKSKRQQKITKKSITKFEAPSIWDLDGNEKAAKMGISLPESKEAVEDIRNTCLTFNAIRDSLNTLKSIMMEKTKDDPNSWQEKTLDPIDATRQSLDLIRKDYISYCIVSPYLYEAHRRAFLARGLINDDEHKVFEAGKLIAKGMHKDWLYEVHESVQDQYITVIRYLKNILSEGEWNELLTITTLTESLDPSKNRNSQKWIGS